MKKAGRALQILVAAAFLVLAIFGAARFPDAPIRKTETGYSNKLGHVKTADEYQKFQLWHRALMIVGAAFAVTAISSVILRYREHGTLRAPQR